MYLTEAQIHDYADQGFLLLPKCFSQAEVDMVKAELPAIFAEESPRRILENDGRSVRFPTKEPRPEFLACRDATPVEPLDENVLRA